MKNLGYNINMKKLTMKQLSNITIILTLFLLLFSPSPAFASSPPPPVGSNLIGSSTGAPMVVGWNYLKLDSGVSGCSIKQFILELQGDGGGALNVDNLWWSSDNGNSFSEIDLNAFNQTGVNIDPSKIYAFNSNQKFFFDLNASQCTNTTANNNRANELENLRTRISQGPGNLLDQLLSVPKAFWQNLFGGNTPSNPTSSISTETEKLTVSTLTVTKTLSVGLINIDPLEPSLSALSTLKIQPDPTLGGVNFLSGKVTIDKDGTLNITKLSAANNSIVGSSILLSGQTKVTISTSSVDANSKIFLTPTTPTDMVLSATNIQANTSFDVIILSSSSSDISFNWWVVESK